MTCEEALPLLSGHLDRENTAEEEQQLQSHLQACPQCRALLQAFEKADAGLLELEEEPPAELHAAVMKAIRAEAPRSRKPHRRAWWSTAVAACLVVLIGVGAWKLPASHREPQAEEAVVTAAYDGEAEAAVPYAMGRGRMAPTPEELADALMAEVALLPELPPELEDQQAESLPDGSALYTLSDAQAAARLCEAWNGTLYTPAQTLQEQNISYAICCP